MTLLQGASERPIQRAEEDQLHRSGFVKRLVDALISEEPTRSTGLTIGLTGPWGSGKSSILNLVREEIHKRYGEKALVVSFDPWLVSGRDDLILRFFAEVGRTIRRSAKTAERFEKVGRRLLSYAKSVAPAADLLLPGAGTVVASGASILDQASTAERDLHELRTRLAEALAKAEGPFVVLIDELDRVEDDEVRAVAQLVRAVLDFPNISFLLAYDAERVVQALGRGAPPGQEAERGRAYLEKIVQLQIPIPIPTREECRHILDHDLGAVAKDLALPAGWAANERYSELAARLIAPEGIATLRDIKRLTGTYHVIVRLVGREVDWVDLLAYAFLLTKAPRTVANIRERAHHFCWKLPPDDHLAPQLKEELWQMSRDSPEAELTIVNKGGESDPTTVFVLKFLFPSFAKRFAPEGGADRLHSWQTLNTVLRLGLIPGDGTRE